MVSEFIKMHFISDRLQFALTLAFCLQVQNGYSLISIKIKLTEKMYQAFSNQHSFEIFQ